MLELWTIHIPSRLADILAYLTQADDIAAVLQYYDNRYAHLSSDQVRQREGRKRDSLSDETFDDVAASSKSNKYRCYTMYIHFYIHSFIYYILYFCCLREVFFFHPLSIYF